MSFKNKYQQPTREQMWYADPVPMFICERCGEQYSAENPGFVDRDGLPVHVKCGKPGELEEYKSANNGHGYQFQLPGWETLEHSEHFKYSAAARSAKKIRRYCKCVWIEDRGKKFFVMSEA